MKYECVRFIEGLTVGACYREELKTPDKYKACVIGDEGEQIIVQRFDYFNVVQTVRNYKPAEKRFGRTFSPYNPMEPGYLILEKVTDTSTRTAIEDKLARIALDKELEEL